MLEWKATTRKPPENPSHCLEACFLLSAEPELFILNITQEDTYKFPQLFNAFENISLFRGVQQKPPGAKTPGSFFVREQWDVDGT